MRGATTYRGVVGHARLAPVRHGFRYRTTAWLVDLDHVPRLPGPLRWLASFDARDHLGEPTATLRANITGFLAARGEDLAGGRILMLANARALGHVFNPLTVHWCYDGSGQLVAVVAEVHNTYGDRHAYLLRPDATGRVVDVELDKAMYVSPFNAVDGTYRIAVSAPGDRVSVSVTLQRPDRPPFVATLHATRRPVTGVLRAALATAATSALVSGRIRWQGVRLYLRGLKVEPRPVHARQEAVG